MDFPVEATLHLKYFQDEAEVRKILRSHGFKMKDLDGGRVRLEGNFSNLKAVKANLEQLVGSQTKTTPSSSSAVQTAFSRAVPKHHNSNIRRSKSWVRDKPPRASATSPSPFPTPLEHRATSSPHYRASLRPGRESFVTDADTYRYADHLRKKDIEDILSRHDVRMDVQEGGDSWNITVLGKSARTAAGELKRLLVDLSKSLRTQEVPWADVDHEGKALLKRIQKNRNIWDSVLLCETAHGLHLIGPSSESYELKQKLLGRSADQSGRAGRSFQKNAWWRLSLPKRAGRERRAIASPSAGGAAGYSPSKYQDDRKEGAEAEQGAAASRGRKVWWKRSHSEPRSKKEAERANNPAERENQRQPKSPTKLFSQLRSALEIKPKSKNQKK